MTTTATLRSRVERDQQRTLAEQRAGGPSAYLDERARALLEVLDWADERPGAVAPWALREPGAGDPARRPDPDGVELELARAESDEQLARSTGQPSRRPGVHGHALAWLLCRPTTEAPMW